MQLNISAKHLLTGAELNQTEILKLLACAVSLKHNKMQSIDALKHKHLALIFEKPSFRTRFSFTLAMRELGGDVIESVSSTRKHEEPEDQIRVLEGYCQAVMVRTFEDEILQRMQAIAKIPIINGLSDQYHPCQILADLMTLKERFSRFESLTICYIGDGNNILHSLLLMATQLGIAINFACPKDFGPNAVILKQAKQYLGKITSFKTPAEAIRGADAVYTDVWSSMGVRREDESAFEGFQVNEALMKQAAKEAVFMHCMPMIRGKEVSQTLPDQPYSVIFQQSENRLHVQKALLLALLSN